MIIKTTYKKLLFIFCFALFMNAKSIAQDTHFSQFWMTPMLLNPAQAGAQEPLRIILNYKNQWNSVAQPYNTGNLSLDARLGKKNKKAFSGIGLNINQDMAGSPMIKTFQLNLNYACHVYLNEKSSLGAGLYGGLIQRSITTSGLQWMNQYDGMSYNSSIASGEPNPTASMMNFD